MIIQSHLKIPKLGLYIGIAIFSLIMCTLFSLLWTSQSIEFVDNFSDPYIWNITIFSLKQALLSTLFSVVGAMPISLAIYRRRFWGRSWLLRLCAMTFVLPVLVAVFGIVSIYGNSGLLQRIFGWHDFSIYGLSGILIAHVFFNLPLSVRILTQALSAIPITQHQLGYHLGMRTWTKFKLIEWPVIKAQILSISSLIFMLCFTSFAIVMTLGGGPQATTIELAIYQAIRYDFDLGLGAVLGIWQLLLTILFTLVFQGISKKRSSHAILRKNQPVFIPSMWLNIWDTFWILICIVFLLPPLISVVVSGVNSEFLHVLSDRSLWHAIFYSLIIALSCATLALSCGIGILLTSRIFRLKKARQKADILELSAMLILVTPSVVLSTGLFLLFNQFTYAADYALLLVVIVNTLMALPYVIKSLSIPFYSIVKSYEPLCISLGMHGLRRLYLIEWRLLKQPIRYAFGLAFILSLGDLSAIALFGSPNFQTLPLYLYRQLGSYQMQAAAVTACILFILSLSIFFFIEERD